MTDDDKVLVDRLREMGEHPCRVDFPIGADLREAADRVEAQAAQIEKLRYELRCIFSDYEGYMDQEWVADVLAALGETK